jgi:hypothetical protein
MSRHWIDEEVPFDTLQGKTLVEIVEIVDSVEGNDILRFVTDQGEIYDMCHTQDCCESVALEDVCGDFAALIGEEILLAEETTSNEGPLSRDDSSFTWTFYHLRTMHGTVTLRWYGTSNGYYSESVELCRIRTDQ